MAAPEGRWHAPALLRVLAAQLLTALADNALLIVAIALLEARAAPAWITPGLRLGFYASYVVLAPCAGRWADSVPKGRLMAAVNAIKLTGAIALAGGAHPLLVFAAIGCAAAAYAPARYGMLPELCSGRQLVQANAAMEIVTIVAIIGGYALGSALVGGSSAAACALLALLYGAAAACTLGPGPAPADARVATPLRFADGARALLGDAVARQALAVTSIFWAAAAVLQFAMIDWARRTLGLALAQAALLPAVFALAMVGGAVLAGAWTMGSGRWRALLCGAALGLAIILMPQAATLLAAGVLLAVAGLLAGLLLVPMNASLQARGADLTSPGLSVAVQNFFENGCSLAFLAAYGIALACGASIDTVLRALGASVVLLVSLSACSAAARARSPTP
ncbi:lysophospholipid transporter LplT [Massilia sp. PWRC2]|uniref:lysophospholipid transporter LplT n=1 Tax=Massilia sp. PWRC2 TaxID=2804626 RepID=UPI003CEF71D1